MKLAKALAAITLAVPAFGQYAGPAILSRGEAPAAMATPQISFRPFLELTGIYDSGLTGVSVVNAQGDLANTAAEGVELAGGVSGTHSWRHTRLGLNYRGSLREFNKATSFDSVNQSLMLSVIHQFTRHVALNLRETAGEFSYGHRAFRACRRRRATIRMRPSSRPRIFMITGPFTSPRRRIW